MRKPHTIKKFYPWFFWYTCSKCKWGFRREDGWAKHIGLDYCNFLCSKCGPDAETALKILGPE